MKHLLSSLLAALLFVPAALHAQVTPTSYGLFTNAPATVATSTTWTTGSSPISVPQGRGLAVLYTLRGSAGTTGGVVTLTFAVSADGTTFSTDTGLQLTVTPTGTNVLTGFKNFPASTLDNVRYIKLASVQNAASALVTNQIIAWSKSN